MVFARRGRVSFSAVLMALSCLAIPCLAIPGHAGDMPPELIPSPDPAIESPVWVAADLVVSPEGDLDFGWFSSFGSEALVRYVERARSAAWGADTEKAARCHSWLGPRIVEWEDRKPNDSLEDLVVNARRIVLGSVDGLRTGFYFARPGTLLRIRVERSWKAPEGAGTTFVDVFHPYAEIPIGSELLCARSERAAGGPAVGDRLLVFVYRDSPDGVVLPDDEELFFERAGADLSLPLRFQGLEDPPSMAEMAESIDEMVEEPAVAEDKDVR